jgi:hypothetical protein
MAAALLGEGMSSPLLDQLREQRGLAYYAACSADVLDTAGQFVVEVSTSPAQLDEALRELQRLLQQQADAHRPGGPGTGPQPDRGAPAARAGAAAAPAGRRGAGGLRLRPRAPRAEALARLRGGGRRRAARQFQQMLRPGRAGAGRQAAARGQ